MIVWEAAAADKDTGTNLESLRLLKVVRMLKLLRAVRLVVFLEKIQSREGYQALKKAIQVQRFQNACSSIDWCFGFRV